jgi:hypothetical protein
VGKLRRKDGMTIITYRIELTLILILELLKMEIEIWIYSLDDDDDEFLVTGDGNEVKFL